MAAVLANMKLFFRQFFALCLKNGIVLAQHPIVNVLRCLVFPIAAAIFLGYAQVFLFLPNNDGVGTPIPVFELADTFDASRLLVWSDGTNGTGALSADDIFARVTKGFSDHQLSSVQKVDAEEISVLCKQNFNGVSGCFAAVTFDGIPDTGSDAPLNYTIILDFHDLHVDVINHKSDYELRMLPLQWAVERAIIELDTGVSPATPTQWPYTQSTNSDASQELRIAFIGFIDGLLSFVYFIPFVGIAYHLAGAVASERAIGLTSHMKAMGLLDSARILSWHVSLSLVYLPAWIVMAVIWQVKLFSDTSLGLVVALHVLTGLSMASWTLAFSATFGKSPYLAAVSATIAVLVCAVIGYVTTMPTIGVAFILTLIFPPFMFCPALRVFCAFATQVTVEPTSATMPDPEHYVTLWPMFIASLISIFLWPYLGMLWERRLYDARNPSTGTGCCGRRRKDSLPVHPETAAISIRNLAKEFRTSIFKKRVVTAISDLSLDIPKNGIFVLLGPNGAGKSTLMSILGGLTGRTSGTVSFEGGLARPPRGGIGIVPQKNVLFPELTCLQTVKLWRAIKPSENSDEHAAEDVEQLLRDCDIGDKMHYKADDMSGGQKRKLQLAIGLVGGSKIVLVDEATSGVDPLSRRAIWQTLTAVKGERTIIFTTHFLDEADLLADDIAVLATPGKLVAHGNPVTLKSTLGDGYTMRATYRNADEEKTDIPNYSAALQLIRSFAPEAQTSVVGPDEIAFHLKTTDPAVVRQVLDAVEHDKDRLQITSYAVASASIESIFLDLMEHEQTAGDSTQQRDDAETPEDVVSAYQTLPALVSPQLQLTSGRKGTVLGQALTIFHKRALIFRRSWLAPLLAVGVAIAASCAPLQFVPKNQATCATNETTTFSSSLFFPDSIVSAFTFSDEPEDHVQIAPPGLLSALGNETASVVTTPIADNASFVREFSLDATQFFLGGVSVDLDRGAALFAWDADFLQTGPVYLNLVSNLLYNRALNSSGRALSGGTPKLIEPSLGYFQTIAVGNLGPLRWAAVCAAALSIYPAFFTLYVAQERRSSVRAMQFSNGLSNPAGLWLGHLVFDSIPTLVVATVLTIVFAAWSSLYQGLGFLWFILVLYGICGTLFAYCWTLIIASPMAVFAAFSAYQIVIFLLYLLAYFLTLTYAPVTDGTREMNIIHFTVSLISPAPSVVRAIFVSINLFSLLCNGADVVTTSALGQITRFGGPILYLILQSILFFGILVYANSTSVWTQRFLSLLSLACSTPATSGAATTRPDVLAEAVRVRNDISPDTVLRVLGVSKSFGGTYAVDDVSFGVARGSVFALLGPNGAGKTTTIDMVRGERVPDTGEILVAGHSVIRQTRAARRELGVCPQFTAIDAQLSVREHLHLYARLKGLQRGAEVRSNVDAVLRATGLEVFADRLASRLSGGNKRKLALAVALIGNPPVLLVDEFSTGIDARTKRDMWRTLKNVAHGKAIVITTHSMEEASTLADRVGILATRMLAVDTTDALIARHARYLVHFPGHSHGDMQRAQELMARIPGARMADDVATRFEVPVRTAGDEQEEGMSLAALFGILAEAGASEYAVEEASLESVFMKVIRENAGAKGDGEGV